MHSLYESIIVLASIYCFSVQLIYRLKLGFRLKKKQKIGKKIKIKIKVKSFADRPIIFLAYNW